jgi:signal transduction histidine kinase
MKRLVDDLLDAARIEAGTLELQMERSDARDLVRAVVDLFEPVARAHHLVTDIPKQPVMLMCDPVRLEQVLTNLINNAIKYSPRGGTVRVMLARIGSTVTLAVTDEGIGMSQADAEHVFEPFRRTEATKTAIPGVGLGLFVAQRIVEAHGGTISVVSTPGKGSTFTVRLPGATA